MACVRWLLSVLVDEMTMAAEDDAVAKRFGREEGPKWWFRHLSSHVFFKF